MQRVLSRFVAFCHAVQIAGPPFDLTQFSGLRALDLSNNRLYGSLPKALLSGLPQLRLLYLDGNLFTGVAPDLDYSAFSDGCSIGGNSFNCPMPAATATCHRDGQPSPACASPQLSDACNQANGQMYQHPQVLMHLQPLQHAEQAVNQPLGQEVRVGAGDGSHSKRSAAVSSQHQKLSFGCVMRLRPLRTIPKGEHQTRRIGAHSSL